MPIDDQPRQADQEATVGLDAQFQIIFFNSAAEAVFGYRAAEVLGQPFEILVPDQLHGTLRPRLETFVAASLPIGQDLGRYEIIGRHKDQHEVPLEAIVRFIELADGRRQYFAFFKDLSAQRQTDHQLHKLSRAVEQSPTAVVITDVLGNIEYVNSKFTELTGYSLAEVLGQNPRLLKSGETSPEEYQQLWATILAGSEWHGTFHNKKKNGELYWESALISPVIDADGHITHFIAHKEDITARRAAELALREERDLVAAILDTSSALIVVLTAEGRIVRFNRTSETISGYTSAEVIERNFWDQLVPPEEVANIRHWFPVRYAEQLPSQAENHWLTKSGQRRLLAWSFSTLPDETGRPKYLIATGLDITEQHRAEEALRVSIADNRALLNAIPDLMFRISRDGTYLDFKSSDQVDLFVPPGQFLGKRVVDVVPGELARQVMQSITEVLGPERGQSQTFDYQLPINGRLNYYEARITASGPNEALMLVRDITQRKRVEEAEHEQRMLAQALRDAAAALNSSLNLDEILDRILDNVGHVVPHDAVNLMLIEDDMVHIARARGYAERGLHDWLMSATVSIRDLFGIDVLIDTLVPLLVSDTRTESRWYELPQTRWIRSYLGVPIQVNGQVVGILNLDSATPGFFKPVHGERLKVFADQAATAIKNAQLVSETRRQAERERLINQITNRIRGSMDIDAIIKTTVMELGRILGASRCLLRLGADADYMPIAHEFTQPGIEPLGVDNRVPPGIRERIMARQTLSIDDTRVSSSSLYHQGIRAVLSTPIMVRNTLLGALSFHECLHSRHWLHDEVDLIETIAAQVGVALENARLYHETRRQLGELSILHTAAIATADSTTHSEALLKVAQSVRDALGDVKVNTLLLAPDKDELVVRASAGFSATEVERIKIRIGQGVTGWVAQTGQPALIPDVKTDPRYVSVDPEVRSELCVPLRSGNRVVGVLNVESHELDAFAERDLQLLTTLSHNLTVIIDNIRLLEEVRAANERLKELDRLKSQFLANVSHELRTPLNAIIGFSELLGDGVAGPLNADQNEYIGNINTSGRHLLSLITDILDLSKIQAGRMALDRQDVPIATLIAEAQTFIVPLAARKQQQFTVNVPVDLPTVNADPLRIKQVLINLLSNACKYTPNGGTIALRVNLIDKDLLLVSVSDTGRGIPLAAQAAIFEEFRQVTDKLDREEGTGLGLAIAQRLIEMHGGKIWVESAGQPGLGSTFYFTLPVQPEKSAETATREAARPVALIVEDDRDFSELLTLHLRQAGYRTRQCYHANEVVSLALELRPSLITLDMVMPDGDGWTLLRELKAAPELRDAGILIISSLEQAQAEVTAGRIEYLPKPLLKNELVQAIDRLKHREPDRPVRVLVVDDDPMLVELLRAILPRPGFEAAAAVNGAHAIDQIMAEPPDLLILDLMMPDMNGFELLAALRNDPRTHDLPVIVLTAKTLEDFEQAELAQSAQSIILKTDLRRDRLLTEIHRLRRVRQPDQ